MNDDEFIWQLERDIEKWYQQFLSEEALTREDERLHDSWRNNQNNFSKHDHRNINNPSTHSLIGTQNTKSAQADTLLKRKSSPWNFKERNEVNSNSYAAKHLQRQMSPNNQRRDEFFEALYQGQSPNRLRFAKQQLSDIAPPAFSAELHTIFADGKSPTRVYPLATSAEMLGEGSLLQASRDRLQSRKLATSASALEYSSKIRDMSHVTNYVPTKELNRKAPVRASRSPVSVQGWQKGVMEVGQSKRRNEESEMHHGWPRRYPSTSASQTKKTEDKQRQLSNASSLHQPIELARGHGQSSVSNQAWSQAPQVLIVHGQSQLKDDGTMWHGSPAGFPNDESTEWQSSALCAGTAETPSKFEDMKVGSSSTGFELTALDALFGSSKQMGMEGASLDAIKGYASGYIDGRCQSQPEFFKVRPEVVKDVVLKMLDSTMRAKLGKSGDPATTNEAGQPLLPAEEASLHPQAPINPSDFRAAGTVPRVLSRAPSTHGAGEAVARVQSEGQAMSGVRDSVQLHGLQNGHSSPLMEAPWLDHQTPTQHERLGTESPAWSVYPSTPLHATAARLVANPAADAGLNYQKPTQYSHHNAEGQALPAFPSTPLHSTAATLAANPTAAAAWLDHQPSTQYDSARAESQALSEFRSSPLDPLGVRLAGNTASAAWLDHQAPVHYGSPSSASQAWSIPPSTQVYPSTAKLVAGNKSAAALQAAAYDSANGRATSTQPSSLGRSVSATSSSKRVTSPKPSSHSFSRPDGQRAESGSSGGGTQAVRQSAGGIARHPSNSGQKGKREEALQKLKSKSSLGSARGQKSGREGQGNAVNSFQEMPTTSSIELPLSKYPDVSIEATILHPTHPSKINGRGTPSPAFNDSAHVPLDERPLSGAKASTTGSEVTSLGLRALLDSYPARFTESLSNTSQSSQGQLESQLEHVPTSGSLQFSSVEAARKLAVEGREVSGAGRMLHEDEPIVPTAEDMNGYPTRTGTQGGASHDSWWLSSSSSSVEAAASHEPHGDGTLLGEYTTHGLIEQGRTSINPGILTREHIRGLPLEQGTAGIVPIALTGEYRVGLQLEQGTTGADAGKRYTEEPLGRGLAVPEDSAPAYYSPYNHSTPVELAEGRTLVGDVTAVHAGLATALSILDPSREAYGHIQQHDNVPLGNAHTLSGYQPNGFSASTTPTSPQLPHHQYPPQPPLYQSNNPDFTSTQPDLRSYPNSQGGNTPSQASSQGGVKSPLESDLPRTSLADLRKSLKNLSVSMSPPGPSSMPRDGPQPEAIAQRNLAGFISKEGDCHTSIQGKEGPPMRNFIGTVHSEVIRVAENRDADEENGNPSPGFLSIAQLPQGYAHASTYDASNKNMDDSDAQNNFSSITAMTPESLDAEYHNRRPGDQVSLENQSANLRNDETVANNLTPQSAYLNHCHAVADVTIVPAVHMNDLQSKKIRDGGALVQDNKGETGKALSQETICITSASLGSYSDAPATIAASETTTHTASAHVSGISGKNIANMNGGMNLATASQSTSVSSSPRASATISVRAHSPSLADSIAAPQMGNGNVSGMIYAAEGVAAIASRDPTSDSSVPTSSTTANLLPRPLGESGHVSGSIVSFGAPAASASFSEASSSPLGASGSFPGAGASSLGESQRPSHASASSLATTQSPSKGSASFSAASSSPSGASAALQKSASTPRSSSSLHHPTVTTSSSKSVSPQTSNLSTSRAADGVNNSDSTSSGKADMKGLEPLLAAIRRVKTGMSPTAPDVSKIEQLELLLAQLDEKLQRVEAKEGGGSSGSRVSVQLRVLHTDLGKWCAAARKQASMVAMTQHPESMKIAGGSAQLDQPLRDAQGRRVGGAEVLKRTGSTGATAAAASAAAELLLTAAAAAANPTATESPMAAVAAGGADSVTAAAPIAAMASTAAAGALTVPAVRADSGSTFSFPHVSLSPGHSSSSELSTSSQDASLTALPRQSSLSFSLPSPVAATSAQEAEVHTPFHRHPSPQPKPPPVSSAFFADRRSLSTSHAPHTITPLHPSANQPGSWYKPNGPSSAPTPTSPPGSRSPGMQGYGPGPAGIQPNGAYFERSPSETAQNTMHGSFNNSGYSSGQMFGYNQPHSANMGVNNQAAVNGGFYPQSHVGSTGSPNHMPEGTYTHQNQMGNMGFGSQPGVNGSFFPQSNAHGIQSQRHMSEGPYINQAYGGNVSMGSQPGMNGGLFPQSNAGNQYSPKRMSEGPYSPQGGFGISTSPHGTNMVPFSSVFQNPGFTNTGGHMTFPPVQMNPNNSAYAGAGHISHHQLPNTGSTTSPLLMNQDSSQSQHVGISNLSHHLLPASASLTSHPLSSASSFNDSLSQQSSIASMNLALSHPLSSFDSESVSMSVGSARSTAFSISETSSAPGPYLRAASTSGVSSRKSARGSSPEPHEKSVAKSMSLRQRIGRVFGT